MTAPTANRSSDTWDLGRPGKRARITRRSRRGRIVAQSRRKELDVVNGEAESTGSRGYSTNAMASPSLRVKRSNWQKGVGEATTDIRRSAPSPFELGEQARGLVEVRERKVVFARRLIDELNAFRIDAANQK
jgi:hypothetical protein